MQLNGWQRSGLVLSIIWVVAAAIYQRQADVERAENFAALAYKTCVDSKSLRHDSDLASCDREKEEIVATFLEGSWGNVAFIALVPVPLGWFGAYVVVGIARAGIIGFRAVVPWSTMTLPRKAFVVAAVFASFAAVLFGVIVVLNLYVDTKVPVALKPRKSVVEAGDGIVVAAGTWTRDGSTEGSKMGFPLQTSEIWCYRRERRCFETRASVSFGNLLAAELMEYEIESWSNTTIVFKNDAPCASEVFTIDRKTESVNGIGHPINAKEGFCARFGNRNENNWNYHLSDGFKVYWEQKQKARPMPLRLIQAFFGN